MKILTELTTVARANRKTLLTEWARLVAAICEAAKTSGFSHYDWSYWIGVDDNAYSYDSGWAVFIADTYELKLGRKGIIIRRIWLSRTPNDKSAKPHILNSDPFLSRISRLSTELIASLISGPLQEICDDLLQHIAKQNELAESAKLAAEKIKNDLQLHRPAPGGYESAAAQTRVALELASQEGNQKLKSEAETLLKEILDSPPFDGQVEEERLQDMLDDARCLYEALREVSSSSLR